MSKDRLIFPLGVIKNSISSHFKEGLSTPFNLNPKLMYEMHVILLRDLSFIKCLLSILCEGRFVFEEIVLFQQHERAALLNYCLLPYRCFEIKDIDVLQLEGVEMREEDFVPTIIDWLENKI